MGEKLRKEREFGDDCYVHMAFFTAGIVAVSMACFKPALMAFLLLEEWRSWVFLFLNLLLLAILFTSTFTRPKELGQDKVRNGTNDNDNNNNDEVSKNDDNENYKENDKETFVKSQSSKSAEECYGRERTIIINGKDSCRAEDDQIVVESPKLSKEELNERAEAFILMFRQHLVLDARKSGKH